MKKISIHPSLLAFVLALPVMIYVHLRADRLAFTYDECWTFLGYATQPITDVVMNAAPAANNHILHSLLMKAAYVFFGMDEYALRLPVLLAMLLFTYYLFKLSQRMLRRLWWVAFIVVLYQPYLIDYFAIARGYAVGLAFLLGAIHHFDQATRVNRSPDIWFSFGLAALAVYANFTFLLPYCALLCCALLTGFTTGKWRTYLLPTGVISLILAGLIAVPLSQLVKAKELYYGGSDGFFSDTLLSLASHTLYERFDGVYLAALFVLTLLLASLWALVNLGRGTWKQAGFWITLVLVASATGSVLQHYLLGSPYLIDRTALFMLPLFLLALCWLIFSYEFMPRKRQLGWILSTAALLNLVVNLNLRYQLDFKEHADTDKAIALVSEMAEPGTEFHLGKSKYMNATIMFYKRKLNVEQILPAGLEECDEAGPTPFYYLFAKDRRCVDDKQVKLVQFFPVSDTYLFQTTE